MTRENAKRLLPIIKAYAEGKTIQLRYDRDGEWVDLDENSMTLNFAPSAYRIKPEAKCRPFKSAEECWNEMQRHQPFGWVKNEKYGKSVVKFLSSQDDFLVGVGEMSILTFDEMLLREKYAFIDGHPFGIKEGEE